MAAAADADTEVAVEVAVEAAEVGAFLISVCMRRFRCPGSSSDCHYNVFKRDHFFHALSY